MPRVLRNHNAHTAIEVSVGRKFHHLITMEDTGLSEHRMTELDLKAAGWKEMEGYDIQRAAEKYLMSFLSRTEAVQSQLMELIMKHYLFKLNETSPTFIGAFASKADAVAQAGENPEMLIVRQGDSLDELKPKQLVLMYNALIATGNTPPDMKPVNGFKDKATGISRTLELLAQVAKLQKATAPKAAPKSPKPKKEGGTGRGRQPLTGLLKRMTADDRMHADSLRSRILNILPETGEQLTAFVPRAAKELGEDETKIMGAIRYLRDREFVLLEHNHPVANGGQEGAEA